MQSGQRYGKYLLLDRIAYGGMAEIFKAKALGAAGFEKNVAIKRLHSRYAEDREVIAMLQDEARIVSRLNHQNICQVLDLGRVDDTYYIAMEFVDGADLASIMRRAEQLFPRALPYPAILFIMNEVLSGLDYAHRKTDPDGHSLGIIHRDISPQNVLVSLEGEVKIIDFGIAKAKGQSHKTEAGVIKGKFRYMSPEQARGEHIDHRADVFAAGVVLYELILGHPHSRGLTDMQVLVRIQQGYLDPLDQLIPDLPVPLTEMVDRALAPRPEDRWPSAGQFKRAVDAFSRSNGLEFNRDNLSELMRRLFPERSVTRRLAGSSQHANPGDLVLESNPAMTQELGLDQLMDVAPLDEPVSPGEADTAYATPLITGTPSPNPREAATAFAVTGKKTADQRSYKDPRKSKRGYQKHPNQSKPEQDSSRLGDNSPRPGDPGYFASAPPAPAFPAAPSPGFQTDPALKAAWDAHQEAKNPPPPEDPPPPFGETTHGSTGNAAGNPPEPDPPRKKKKSRRRWSRASQPSKNYDDSQVSATEDVNENRRINRRQERVKAGPHPRSKSTDPRIKKAQKEHGLGGTILYLVIIAILLGGAVYIGHQYLQALKEDKKTTAPAKGDDSDDQTPNLIQTTIQISTKPKKGAQIFINGRDTGSRTPAVLDLQAPSPIIVELVKDGFPRWVNEFPLTPGEPLRIEADLRRPPQRGGSTKSRAGRRSTKKRRRRRRTTPKKIDPVETQTGRIIEPGERDEEEEAMGAVYGPGADDTKKSTIEVKSSEKAWVYINDQRMGISPYSAVLSPGNYKIYVKKGDRKSVPKYIKVEGGKNRRISFKLR